MAVLLRSVKGNAAPITAALQAAGIPFVVTGMANLFDTAEAEVDPEEYTLKLASEPFPLRGYKRIAVKVVDVYGNESTVVREVETPR